MKLQTENVLCKYMLQFLSENKLYTLLDQASKDINVGGNAKILSENCRFINVLSKRDKLSDDKMREFNEKGIELEKLGP